MFFFKRKEIVVDCFTSNLAIHDVFPIQPSIKFLPEWWKKLPSTTTQTINSIEVSNGTIKICDGFISYYKNSITIPMWCDLGVKTTSEGSWNYLFAGTEPTAEGVTSHNRDEYGPAFDNYIHLKIMSPWIISEKTGVNFLFTYPFWNNFDKKGYPLVPPGIVEYKHQNTSNVNVFFKKENSQFIFNSGDALVNLIPLTDKKVIVKNHLVTPNEYHVLSSKSGYNHSFFGKYKKTKKIMQSRGKCPFGFGG